LKRMIVPVWTTYGPKADFARIRAADIRGMVDNIFEYMIDHGTPCNPDTIEAGDYGPELEQHRESLTLFIGAWHNLAFAYYDTSNDPAPDGLTKAEIKKLLADSEAPDRTVPGWKIAALRAMFPKAKGWD
jgi:hypothetical protein